MAHGHTVTVIIPALNEESAIGSVVGAVPTGAGDEVIVVDNGSTDGTATAAAAAGARVVAEPRRGYGWACRAGAAAAGGEILVFIDGDGSFDPGQIPVVTGPILQGKADLVLGSRAVGGASRAVLPHQRVGNWLAVQLLRQFYGLPVTDLGPFRAIRAASLQSLQMEEMTYGWPIEMMVKAAQTGCRVVEVAVSYGPRQGGQSKVSGTVRGSLLAGYRILRVLWRHAWRRPGAARVEGS